MLYKFVVSYDLEQQWSSYPKRDLHVSKKGWTCFKRVWVAKANVVLTEKRVTVQMLDHVGAHEHIIWGRYLGHLNPGRYVVHAICYKRMHGVERLIFGRAYVAVVWLIGLEERWNKVRLSHSRIANQLRVLVQRLTV